jgi:hypothetical protein
VKEECREVISTITRTFTVFLDYYITSPETSMSGPRDSAEMQELRNAYRDSLEVFYAIVIG